MTTIFLVAVFIIPACSFNKDVYKQELFQFDNVFINRSVSEDKNYVYVAGL